MRWEKQSLNSNEDWSWSIKAWNLLPEKKRLLDAYYLKYNRQHFLMKQTILVYEIELQDMLIFQLIIYDERIDWIMSYNTCN